MALFNETEIMEDGLLDVAREMIIAAKTAPKGRGIDNMVYAILKDADDIERLSNKMIEMGEKYDQHAFIHNGKTILECKVIVLLGTKIKSLGLKKCGFCGFANCTEKDKHPEIPCAFNLKVCFEFPQCPLKVLFRKCYMKFTNIMAISYRFNKFHADLPLTDFRKKALHHTL